MCHVEVKKTADFATKVFHVLVVLHNMMEWLNIVSVCLLQLGSVLNYHTIVYNICQGQHFPFVHHT